MRQLWILVAPLLGLAACKANPMESGGGGSGAALGPPPPSDWTTKKLVSQTGTIEGLAFTIDVPDGLPRDPRQGGDWDSQDARYDSAPKIFTSTIEIARIQDLKEAKYHGTLDAARKTWVREQSRPDSWALTYAEPDKSRIEAITYKQATDTLFIRCKAVQSVEGGAIPSYAKARTMLETICDSLKPTGAAPAAPPPTEEKAEPVEKAPEGGEPDKAPEPAEPAGNKPAEPAGDKPAESGGGRLQKAAGDKAPE